jgi:hypothetical protein
MAAVIISTSMWGLDFYLRQTHNAPIGNLLLEVGAAAALWTSLVTLSHRSLSPELRSLIAPAVGRMRSRLRSGIAGNAR